MKRDILKKTKEHCLKVLKRRNNRLGEYLPGHIDEVERWAGKISKNYAGVNKKILFLSVFLHDIGHGLTGHDDHAVKSEIETRKFLKKIGCKKSEIEKVAHCVRAHRCKDLQPATIEGKILAVADSASHMTDGCYIDMAKHGLKEAALGKMERDYRDVHMFPKVKKEIGPLYLSWKKILKSYPF